LRTTGNLFSFAAARGDQHELIDTLLDRGGVTVERIVSTGQASAPGFWYDSPRDEWVVLLTGAAGLEFEGVAQLQPMQPGDYLLIDAHRRHRVAWTHDSEPTVWLAIHYRPDDAAG